MEGDGKGRKKEIVGRGRRGGKTTVRREEHGSKRTRRVKQRTQH